MESHINVLPPVSHDVGVRTWLVLKLYTCVSIGVEVDGFLVQDLEWATL